MDLLQAVELADRLHAGETDKAGRPYILHLIRTMLRVQAAGGDLDQQIAALLHDSIEHRRATEASLLAAGVPAQAVQDTVDMTRPQGMPYALYIAAIAKKKRVALIKRQDLADNSDEARIALLPLEQAASLRKRYQRAIATLDAAIRNEGGYQA